MSQSNVPDAATAASGTIIGPAQATDEASKPGIFWRYLLVPALYTASMVLLAAVLLPYLGAQPITARGLQEWDAEHYLFICNQGYDLIRTAFFPAFPLLWRATGLGTVGICVLNLGLFVLAFAALARAWRLPVGQQLLALSIPSMFFMGVAYSEALFFVGGAATLIGWRQQQMPLAWAGLLLCSCTRSVAFMFVPALLLTAWLLRHQGARLVWRQALGGVLASVAGMLISLWVHYRDTGIWLAFVRAQREGWNNHLQVPAWPLSSWGGDTMTRYESLALLVAVACALYLAYLLLQPSKAASLPFGVIFSMLYIAGVATITVATKGGIMASLSRYAFASPFFVVLLGWVLGQVRLDCKRLLWVWLAAEVCWLGLFRTYGHVRTLTAYLLLGLAAMVVLATASTHPRVRQAALVLSIAGNSALLLWLLQRFIVREWAG
ncbi:hypothetical protein [Solirubrum puertoriconensis]|uniref:Uncharacterized protein n=1 Tax=Solirubrum puertoriconensis TaxID=1751427 RepID=A0A9X0L6N0_SOLP1|nr:hypothetical protein [Solirubrum puertoriconensis]KUG09930.1 hypothetical protein ASU33_20485 [Solirubrum puertoriconensis]